MQLYYYKDQPNFGDQLNPWLWPQLLPGLFEDGLGSMMFLGIGSILNERVPIAPHKIVFGSGFGYGRPTNVHDGKWSIYCVRGPRTARALGLPRRTVVTDSAVLVGDLAPAPARRPRYRFSFMPHHLTAALGDWEDAASLAGIRYIDPRAPVDEVLARMCDSEVVITEAMHGAIVADALRIPWIAVRPRQSLNEPKWLDWADSLSLSLRFHEITSASVREALQVRVARARTRLRQQHTAAAALSAADLSADAEPCRAAAKPAAPAAPGGLARLYLCALNAAGPRKAWRLAKKGVPRAVWRKADAFMAARAAEALTAAARAEPQLSGDAVLARAREQLDVRLYALKKDLGVA